MTRIDLVALTACVLAVAAGSARAEPETLTQWQWFQEVKLTGAAPGTRYLDFLLPPTVFGKAREDLQDLRLYDADGREVEYALRILQSRHEERVLAARDYNRATGPDGAAEWRIELADVAAREHNAVDIDAGGNNVRRKFRLEGSDTDSDFRELTRGEYVRYEFAGQRIDVRRFRYPTSRFRFLRLTLEPDPTVENDKPQITAVRVLRWVEVPGEVVTQQARLSAREPVPGDDGPGSAWRIEFDGNQPPVERLSFEVTDAEFARPYRLEAVSPEGQRRLLATGEWRRRAGSEPGPLEIVLPREEMPYKLRLVVTDHRNQLLTIRSVQYSAPARQVVFPVKPETTGPLRLFYGNPKAGRPGYDFANNLPVELTPAPVRLTASESVTEQPQPNPVYEPEPMPFTERFPWVIYCFLTLACLVLLGILSMMGRQAVTRHDGLRAKDQ